MGVTNAVEKLMKESLKKDPKVRAGRTAGRRSGISFWEFLHSAFSVNEFNPRNKKLTDDQIEAILFREYTGKTLDKFKRGILKGNYTLGTIRAQFNAHKVCHKTNPKPKRVSLKYSGEGLPIKPRANRGLSIMTPLAILERAVKYQIKDDRFAMYKGSILFILDNRYAITSDTEVIEYRDLEGVFMVSGEDLAALLRRIKSPEEMVK